MGGDAPGGIAANILIPYMSLRGAADRIVASVKTVASHRAIKYHLFLNLHKM
jgi:hypothetical protein